MGRLVESQHPTTSKPPSLAYAGTHVQSVEGPPVTSTLLCLCVTLVAATTAVRIEILNNRAGGILPRTEAGAWTVDVNQTRPIRGWNPRLMKSLAELQVEKDLLDVVSTWGCAQLIIAPMALTWSAALCFHKPATSWRLLAFACTFISLITVALFLYRAYIPSLSR